MEGIQITINAPDVRGILQKAHLSQMADNEKLEGRDGWMFLCGMAAMATFCADSFEELGDQAQITEVLYQVALAMSEQEGGFREKLIEASDNMVAILDAAAEREGVEDE